MKRIKRFIFTFIALFLLFPCLTSAATELSASTQNPIVGNNLYIQLEANYGQTLKIKDFHVYIDFDSTYFDVVEIKWVKSRTQMGTHRIENGKVYVDKEGANWSSGPVLQVELKVKKTGSTKINIVETKPANYTDGSQIAQTMAGIVINSVAPSTNVNLGSLYVKGYSMQPAFKQSHTEYNLTVPANVDKIEIVTKKNDINQTITGQGIKTLRYGPNKFRIIVTAQNKDSKTYELTVTRTDTRTGDVSLKTLNVTNTIIKAEAGKTEYEATVGRNTESILISARTNDPMATLTGTGTKQLEIGENKFELLVQSSNGKEQIYTIKINRSTEELEPPVKSSNLKAIKINNLSVKVTEDTTTYLYGISNIVDPVKIEPILVSPTATYEMTGHENLKAGINKIKIKVTQIIQEAVPETEEDLGSEAVIEETEYTLLLYKNPHDALEITSFDQITGDNHYIYTTIEQESHKISKDIIKTLSDNKKTLYFNVVNMYTGLLYQVKLPKFMVPKDYELKLLKEDPDSFTYNTNLPENTELTIFVGDQYEDGTGVQVYSYNDGEPYNLITAGVEVINGYVTITTNEQKNYIITTTDLIVNQTKMDKLINTIKTVGVFIVIIALIIFIVPKITKKKNKIEESKEPLY